MLLGSTEKSCQGELFVAIAILWVRVANSFQQAFLSILALCHIPDMVEALVLISTKHLPLFNGVTLKLVYILYCRPISVVSGKEETRRAMWIPNKLLHDYYQEFPEDKSVCFNLQ